MVRIHPDPPGQGQDRQIAATGAVAQLGERLLCKQEVVGSIPSSSTSQVSEVRQSGIRLEPYPLSVARQHSAVSFAA